MVPQRVSLGETVAVKQIRFTIAGVYPGTRWDDTCISEIRFFREGEQQACIVQEPPDSSSYTAVQ